MCKGVDLALRFRGVLSKLRPSAQTEQGAKSCKVPADRNSPIPRSGMCGQCVFHPCACTSKVGYRDVATTNPKGPPFAPSRFLAVYPSADRRRFLFVSTRAPAIPERQRGLAVDLGGRYRLSGRVEERSELLRMCRNVSWTSMARNCDQRRT